MYSHNRITAFSSYWCQFGYSKYDTFELPKLVSVDIGKGVSCIFFWYFCHTFKIHYNSSCVLSLNKISDVCFEKYDFFFLFELNQKIIYPIINFPLCSVQLKCTKNIPKKLRNVFPFTINDNKLLKNFIKQF